MIATADEPHYSVHRGILQSRLSTRIVRSPSNEGRAPRFDYQRQGSTLTLAQGFDEYYRGHPDLIRPEGISPERAGLFRHHDICHVIFGLDTTLVDEAMADFRTVLSTDVGLRRYLRTNKEDQQIFEKIDYLRALGATMRAIPRFSRALTEALRARQGWLWHPPEQHFGKRLGSLRAAYRIRVI
jgi:hypothetical protein